MQRRQVVYDNKQSNTDTNNSGFSKLKRKCYNVF